MDDLKTWGDASSVLLPGSQNHTHNIIKVPQLLQKKSLLFDVDVRAGLLFCYLSVYFQYS